MNAGLRVVLSVFATLASALAALLFLATALMTEGFTGQVPSGASAMGLVVPFLGSGFAAVLLVVAALCCAWRGGLDWSGPHPAWFALLASVGIAAAGFGMFLAWAERAGAWVIWSGWLLGGVAPLAACLLLAACAWWPLDGLREARWPRIAGVALLAEATFGFLLAAYGVRAWVLDERADAQRAAAALAAEQAEDARRAALTPAQSLQETLAGYDPATPLWILAAMLRDTPEPELRALLIERSLQVPDFEAELAHNLASEVRVYRHAAVELVRDAPAGSRIVAWRAALAESLRTTAAELAADPEWFVAEDTWHPDPPAHVRALLQAAQALGPEEALDAAAAQLREALSAHPDGRAAEVERGAD